MTLLLLFSGSSYSADGLVCVTITGSTPGDSASSSRATLRFSATSPGSGFSAGRPGDGLSGGRPATTFGTQECD